MKITIEKSQELYKTISPMIGGSQDASFMLIVVNHDDMDHPAVISDVPEEFLKRFITKIAYSMIHDENTEVAVGDEIAFRLEARLKTEQ